MLADEKEIRKEFGQRIKQLRTDRGWSQAGLSHIAEIDPGYVGKIERGETNPGLTYMVAIARAFDMPVWELLKY